MNDYVAVTEYVKGDKRYICFEVGDFEKWYETDRDWTREELQEFADAITDKIAEGVEKALLYGMENG